MANLIASMCGKVGLVGRPKNLHDEQHGNE
jgi:hypothetical protein